MNIYEWILMIVSIVVVWEIGLFLLVHHLRKDYQWLITSKDECPNFNKTALKKFFKHGYDPLLGWVRKPNTSGKEEGPCGQTVYSINAFGARVNPGYESVSPLISCYGDSFTFCRQVDDNETWEHYLSELTQKNVLNFGVGNYGIDQSLIRLEREYQFNSTRIVILSAVPETISRVLNVWKHYHEYGNTFGFKPRYKIENGKLTLIKQIMDEENKFYKLWEYLPDLQKKDFFYKNKFKKDQLRFPYLFSLKTSWKRNIPLIAHLIQKRLYDGLGIFPDYIDHLHNKFVLRRNIQICAKLYQKPEIVELVIAILKKFVGFCLDHDAVPVFAFFPQLNDIKHIQKKGKYYQKFIDQVNRMLLTIDFTDTFTEANGNFKFYSNDLYGGHISKDGNELIANVFFKTLKEKGLL